MAENKIYYAVIALTKTQVEDLILEFNKKEGMKELADWLNENKDDYDEQMENWKPFGDEKITDIIHKNADNYKSETLLIEKLDENCKNVYCLIEINIYFIDIFALYLEKYNNFATRCDFAFCDAKKSICCFLINNSLPHNIQEQLLNIHKEAWPSVSEGFENGSINGFAYRAAEVKNFKNQVLNLLTNEINPHPNTFKTVGQYFKPDRPRPDLGG